MADRRIVVATGNAHKVREIREILAPLGYEVQGVNEVGGMPDVLEDAETFAGNAAKKAMETAKVRHCAVIADDSGLEVQALHGAPGIHSARYAGEPKDDRRNLQKLLREMEGCQERQARFVSVIAVADAEGNLIGSAEGEVRGRIAQAPMGEGGFGYDPVFIPDGYEQSFGVLPAEVKNGMSHRARALEAAIRAGLFR